MSIINELIKSDNNVKEFSLDNQILLGKVVDCYDADTCRINIILNNKLVKFNCRLYGIDTPEMRPLKSIENRDEIIKKAHTAKNYLLSLIMRNNNFNLDDAVLGNEGRKVKCGKCGHRWRAIPDVLLDKPISEPDDDILTSARQEEKAVEADPFTDLTNNTDGAEGGILADQITTSNGNESFSSHARSQSGLEDTLAKGAGEESIKATKPISRISKWVILTVAVATILLGIIFRTDLARIYPPIEKIFQLLK